MKMKMDTVKSPKMEKHLHGGVEIVYRKPVDTEV
jgi:hypothetical protein